MAINEKKPSKLSNKKILIVEDEIPLLNALIDKFTREGFTVFAAQNGAEGLELALREQPDIILLDLVMPEMTGLDVMKNLRGANEWGKKVKIILLTNLALNERLQRETSKQEPSYYLIKSDWKIEDIVKKVKECVGVDTETQK